MHKRSSYGSAETNRTGHSFDLLWFIWLSKTVGNLFSSILLPTNAVFLELKNALATSQHRLNSAQQQIETLKDSNGQLNRKLVLLEKKYVQAQHFAYHDELTGLPNRSLLLDRLNQAMTQAVRQQKQVALLFIDLDGFKHVNDRLGHLAGDKLLQQVADRLSACIRNDDTVCRYGGDEFVIMLTGINAQENAAALTDKIHARLSSTYLLDGNVINITASIGVAISKGEVESSNDLIKQADNAMYRAKVVDQTTKHLNTHKVQISKSKGHIS